MSTQNILALISLVVNILAIVYTLGRWSQKFTDHDNKLGEHATVIATHAEKLEDQNLRIDRLEQWHKGFQAAADISGGGKKIPG